MFRLVIECYMLHASGLGLSEGQEAVAEVDIGPTERELFGSTHTREDGQANPGSEVWPNRGKSDIYPCGQLWPDATRRWRQETFQTFRKTSGSCKILQP